MKDAIIIALCTVILGGAGFVAAMVMTKDEPAATVDTSKLSADLKAKANAVTAPDSTSGARMHNEMMYGGIGAVVGLLGGAGVSAAVGKKK